MEAFNLLLKYVFSLTIFFSLNIVEFFIVGTDSNTYVYSNATSVSLEEWMISDVIHSTIYLSILWGVVVLFYFCKPSTCFIYVFFASAYILKIIIIGVISMIGFGILTEIDRCSDVIVDNCVGELVYIYGFAMMIIDILYVVVAVILTVFINSIRKTNEEDYTEIYN